MTVVKPARDVAVEFLLRQGRHFCENSYCDCIDRLAELIQWERSIGAAVERARLEESKKRPLAKVRAVPTSNDLNHVDIRKAQ